MNALKRAREILTVGVAWLGLGLVVLISFAATGAFASTEYDMTRAWIARIGIALFLALAAWGLAALLA